MSTMTSTDAADHRLRRRWILFALTLLAIMLEGASLRLRAARETEPWPPLQGDSIDYVSAAYNLREFGVFSRENLWSKETKAQPRPDAVRDPGYPAMLSLLLSGPPDWPFFKRVLLLQALLGTLVVGVTWLFAAQLLPRFAALAVTALVAVNPQLISLGTAVLTETLFSLLVAASLYAIARACLRGKVAWYAIAGICIGLSALVRPTLEFLPLLLLPATAWLVPEARWKGCLVLLLGVLLTFAPWMVRNERAIGAVSDSTLMTNTLLHGSYKDFMYDGQQRSLGFPYRFDPASATITTPAQALVRIGDNFAADTAGMLRWYLLSKPVRFFDWDFLEGAGGIFINDVRRSPYLEGQRDFVATYGLMRLLHWPLIALAYAGMAIALVGAIRGERTAAKSAAGVLAVYMLFVIGLHVIGLPLGRYSAPFRPLTYAFAMLPLCAVAGRWSAKAREGCEDASA